MCSPEFMGKECCNRVSDNSDKAAECVRAIGSEAACSSWRFMAEQCACGAVIVQEKRVGLVGSLGVHVEVLKAACALPEKGRHRFQKQNSSSSLAGVMFASEPTGTLKGVHRLLRGSSTAPSSCTTLPL